MNILLINGVLSASLVFAIALIWPKAPTGAIAFVVSIIVASTSPALDFLDDGRLDPFFLMSVAAAWFLSLMIGMITGWFVDKGCRTRHGE